MACRALRGAVCWERICVEMLREGGNCILQVDPNNRVCGPFCSARLGDLFGAARSEAGNGHVESACVGLSRKFAEKIVHSGVARRSCYLGPKNSAPGSGVRGFYPLMWSRPSSSRLDNDAYGNKLGCKVATAVGDRTVKAATKRVRTRRWLSSRSIGSSRSRITPIFPASWPESERHEQPPCPTAVAGSCT